MTDDPLIAIGSVTVWILGIATILINPAAIHSIGIGIGLMSHPFLMSLFGTVLAAFIAMLIWTIDVFAIADFLTPSQCSHRQESRR